MNMNYNKKVAVSVELSVMQLVEALEKILPAGEMVIVGSGDCMTEAHKAWLRSLIGDAPCKCECEDRDAIEQTAYDEGYNDGYADAELECSEVEDEAYDRGYRDAEESAYERGRVDGYEDGYADAMAEVEESEEMDTTALARIREILDEVGAI